MSPSALQPCWLNSDVCHIWLWTGVTCANGNTYEALLGNCCGASLLPTPICLSLSLSFSLSLAEERMQGGRRVEDVGIAYKKIIEAQS